MAFLEKFSNADKELLIALPYRVGVWLSRIDDIGGEDSDYSEQRSLKEIIYKKGRGMFESAFVHEVLAETCTREKDWPLWETKVENVLDECLKAKGILHSQLEQRDVDAFILTLMDVAIEVAVAYREFDNEAGHAEKFFTNIKIMIDKLIGIFARQSYISERLLNISYKEDVGLSKLAHALGIDADEKPAEVN